MGNNIKNKIKGEIMRTKTDIEKEDKWKNSWIMIAFFLWELGIGLLIGCFIGGILR